MASQLLILLIELANLCNSDVRLQKLGWKQGDYPEFGSPVPPGKEIRRPSGEAEVEK